MRSVARNDRISSIVIGAQCRSSVPVTNLHAQLAICLIFVPLTAWIARRRASHDLGRPPIQSRQTMFQVVVSAVIGVPLAMTDLHKFEIAEGLLAGVIPGSMPYVRPARLVIAWVRGDGWVLNPWIGAFLTLLLGRPAWRSVVLV